MIRLPLFIIFLLFTSTFATGQLPSMVKLYGGINGSEEAHSIAIDSKNNIYSTGFLYYNTSVSFDSISFNSPSYFHSIVVVKQDATGKAKWVKRAGSPGEDKSTRGLDIKVDKDDNVYVAGYYWGQNTFDGHLLPGTGGIFLAKINPEGVIEWLKTNDSYVPLGKRLTISISSTGLVYLVTTLQSSATIENNTISVPGNNENFYIACYDTSGNFKWVKKYGQYQKVTAADHVLDNEGNIILCGTWSSSFTIDTITLYKNQNHNVFVAKLDSNGNAIWARDMGYQEQYDYIRIDVDSKGDIFTGKVSGSLLKMSGETGTILWQSSTYSLSGFQPMLSDVHVDRFGNAYFLGTYYDEIVIGPYTKTGGFFEMFLFKFSNEGNLIWARDYGYGGYDYGNAMTTGGQNEDIYICGRQAETGSSSNHYHYIIFKWDAPVVTSIDEQEIQSQYTVYPNPVSDQFRVLIKNKKAETFSFKMIDAQGKTFIDSENISQDFTFERASLPSGIYYYTVRTEDKMEQTGKIILK